MIDAVQSQHPERSTRYFAWNRCSTVSTPKGYYVIHRHLESGLVVAEHGMDSISLERELSKRDPLLSLQGWPDPEYGRIRWRVVRETPEGGFETVVCWPESGEPYPLSSGILDLLDRHDRNNTRRDYKDEDELERERRAAVTRQQERDDEALVDDWTPKHGRPVLHRGQSLRMARDKRRAKGEKC